MIRTTGQRLRPDLHEPRGTAWLRNGIALAALTPWVLLLGWRGWEPHEHALLHWIGAATLAIYLAAHLWTSTKRRGASSRFSAAKQLEPFEAATAAIGLVLSFWAPAAAIAAIAVAMTRLLRAYLRLTQTSKIPGGLVFVGSFTGVILLGAGALMLPAATPVDKPIGPLDAVFTSTSAVCVTGLAVRDTAVEFTRFGQGILLLLIQLGGLGIVVFGALLALAFGSALGLRTGDSLGGDTSHGANPAALRKVVVFIITATIVVEIVGATTLFLGWPSDWAGAPDIAATADRAFHSLFFSISAFCNAGFATTANSLEGLRTHWTSHLVIASLIVVGGLGFPVLQELRRVGWSVLRRRKRSLGANKLNLHTKLVLTTTALLYLAGFAGLLLARLTHEGQAWDAAVLDAHFGSITARTAGFDTAALGDHGPLSRFVFMFLMFIGGSPGSTAGGVKTITLAVLLLTVWATIGGRDSTEAYGRRLSDALVRRAATLIVLGLATIVGVASALLATDGARFSFDRLVFEAVSACSTVGLSMGVTPDLSGAGKSVLIVGMFLGRVGPLAALAALVSVAGKRRPRYAYATEDVLMS